MSYKDLGRSPSPYKRQSEIPIPNSIPTIKQLNLIKIRDHIIKHISSHTKFKNHETDNNKSNIGI